MHFQQPLIEGILIKRYKRFLADIQLPSQEIITVYCPNTGSMSGVLEPAQRAWIYKEENIKRKLPYTLIALEHNSTMVGVHTHYPNKIVEEGLRQKTLFTEESFSNIQNEIPYGINSRIDFLATDNDNNFVYIEVKNVSMTNNNGSALFPDTTTLRGQKHLKELMHIVEQGHRAIMCYIIQRNDVTHFGPAANKDPVYTELFYEALTKGVEMYAWNCTVSTTDITINQPLILISR